MSLQRDIARTLTERPDLVPWPEPSHLGDELPPVQQFSTNLLPQSFLPLVQDLSERMQTPPDFAAATVVVSLAGSVNRRALIQPKPNDYSWLVVPNLWGAIIGPPGFMKSPVLRSTTLPLMKIEEVWRAEHENAAEEYESAKEQAELANQAWREQYKAAIKKGGVAPVQPDKSLTPPAQRRLVLTDATFEKLHEILSDNPAGVLVVRDELTGWLAEMEKPGREGERAFYLQAWNGDASFTVDRIGRGSIHVPNVCVSLLGNIQPSRLRAYLDEALAGGPTDDGLFQRFQILVWPDLPKTYELIDRAPNGHAIAMAEKVLSCLANLSADNPAHLRLDPEAQDIFFGWLRDLEAKIRLDAGLSPPVVAHLAKYRSLLPTLAGLFELADEAAVGNGVPEQLTISIPHIAQAVEFCDYLESHANRVYSCVVSPESRAARELGRHIQKGDLPTAFKTREVYLRGWSGLGEPNKVRAALELLEDAGWLRPLGVHQSLSGGRPSESWEVNPKVFREK